MSEKRSAGPYSYDDDEDYVPSKAVKYSSLDNDAPGDAKAKVHTLDSDEEDLPDDGNGCVGSEKAFDVLKDDDIEGELTGKYYCSICVQFLSTYFREKNLCC